MSCSTTRVLGRLWFRTAVALAVVACLTLSGGAQQPNRVRGVAGPSQAPAYLALGDSAPHGSDGSGFLPNNDNFWVGYPDYLSTLLDRPLVNASCPGETTDSFLTGTPPAGGWNCGPVRDAGLMHVDYTGSQMEFAETYLATHPRVVLVTLQLGANDTQRFVAACQGNLSCIMNGLPGFLAYLAGNFDTILAAIRNTGYEGPIIVVEYPATNFNGRTAQIQLLAYQAVKPVVEAYGGQMAPVFARFNAAALPYGGDSCAAGLLITNADGSCNPHYTEAGHQLIADIIAEMLGFVPGGE